jgi:hypothetical protein
LKIRYSDETELAGTHTERLCLINTKLGMKFVYIPPGEFMMGSPESESDRLPNETRHRVTLTKGFFMQTTLLRDSGKQSWKAILRISKTTRIVNLVRIDRNIS